MDVKSLDKGQLEYVIGRLREKYAPESDMSFLQSMNLEGLQTLLSIVLTQDAEKRAQMMAKIFAQMKEDVKKIEELKFQVTSLVAKVKEMKADAQNQEDVSDIEKMLEDY